MNFPAPGRGGLAGVHAWPRFAGAAAGLAFLVAFLIVFLVVLGPAPAPAESPADARYAGTVRLRGGHAHLYIVRVAGRPGEFLLASSGQGIALVPLAGPEQS